MSLHEPGVSGVDAFRRKLRRWSAELRAASKGRTCGECGHADFHGGTGLCRTMTALHVDEAALYVSPLRIWRREAVACGEWAEQDS